jgi:hypothetical protein
MGTSAEGKSGPVYTLETVTSRTEASIRARYGRTVRVHVFSRGSRVLFFEEPRPEVPGSDYLGALDLSPDEVVELRLMAEEMKADQR